MYTQGQMFLVAISKTIQFIMIQYITESKIHILNKSLNNKFILYNQVGFQIQRINVYTEFKPMEDTFEDIDITINYVTSQEHVL